MVTTLDILKMLDLLDAKFETRSEFEGKAITFWTLQGVLVYKISFDSLVQGYRILEAVAHYSDAIISFKSYIGLSEKNAETLKIQHLRQELTIHEAKAKIKSPGECLIWRQLF